MNRFDKVDLIQAGLRKGFQNGTSKMAGRKCYGYDCTVDGTLGINPDEAKVVRWIFDRYLVGDSLGQIAAGLERKGIPSPSGKVQWNREALNKLLFNEKYVGQVLLQRTVTTGFIQIKNDSYAAQYFYPDHHDAIITEKQFEAVQRAKQIRAKISEFQFSIMKQF